MGDFVDLHCHYIPNVDDGVKSQEEGLALCKALQAIGFGTVVATPHIRTTMFENNRRDLEAAFSEFQAKAKKESPSLPMLYLAAEHFFDDVFWQRLERDDVISYPGQRAILIEFAYDQWPLNLEHAFFNLQLRNLTPVLAHPERYSKLFKSTEPLFALTQQGVRPLLDVMSLVGKYGRKPQKAAERMLDEGIYYAACSDAHKPQHVLLVEKALGKLQKRVGTHAFETLMSIHPRKLLSLPSPLS